MAGYADPCPLCPDHKRRRHGAFLSHLGEPHPGLPAAPLKLFSKLPMQAAPVTSPPRDETLDDNGVQNTVSPPVTTGAGGDRTPSPPKTPLDGCIGGTRSSRQGSSDECDTPARSVRQDRPDTCSAAAAAPTKRSPTPPGTAGSRSKLEAGDTGGYKEEASIDGKGGARASRASGDERKEKQEVAAIRIRCKCGRVQEFLYRQKRT